MQPPESTFLNVPTHVMDNNDGLFLIFLLLQRSSADALTLSYFGAGDCHRRCSSLRLDPGYEPAQKLRKPVKNVEKKEMWLSRPVG